MTTIAGIIESERMRARAAGARHALQTAAAAPGQFKHGAVIMDGACVVAASPNTPTLHAEARAFLRCPAHVLRDPARRSQLTMYVARVAADGIPSLSKPCANCQRLIRHHGIRRVYYTTGSAADRAAGRAASCTGSTI